MDRRSFNKLLAATITSAGISRAEALETPGTKKGSVKPASQDQESSGAEKNNTWAEHPVTGIGTNIWAPEWLSESITKWDPDKLADSLANAGIQVAFTFQGFTQDHFGISYFPTRMGPTHRNLNGHDHIREYLDAMHKRNIRVFGYYSFPDANVWTRNPDWHQVSRREGNSYRQLWRPTLS
jgi:hypothetical protein